MRGIAQTLAGKRHLENASAAVKLAMLAGCVLSVGRQFQGVKGSGTAAKNAKTKPSATVKTLRL